MILPILVFHKLLSFTENFVNACNLSEIHSHYWFFYTLTLVYYLALNSYAILLVTGPQLFTYYTHSKT